MSRIRLICPNCGAQYEVPADVVPDAGRDVQCSNCGHTWFQRHPDQDLELTEELNQPVPDTEWAPEAEAQTPPPAPEPSSDPEFSPPPAPEPAPAKRQIDPDMAELFREEREFEASQRAAQALESQPDLGLQDPGEGEQARRSREARDRMAKMRGEEPAAAPTPPPPAAPEPHPMPQTEPAQDRDFAVAQAAAAAAAGSRRDLLPDVEEINQTLRSSSESRVIDSAPGEELAPDKPQKKGGFGKGFLTIAVLAAIAVGAYVFAPQISAALPQAKPALDGYVAKVDAGRGWLDGQVTHLLTTLDGMSSEAEAPASDG
ncbi:zinc-ribbon domain-containing protein [uncultured Pelagimonas sp.]|uniref:zinc-ribbon domain-containing protein n=1 Tax=uncultured Pelagimonas sp. TaxID=1618102 RepID=UPI00345B1D40